MKAVFVTLGCKVNQYETRILEERFAQAGIVPAEKGEKADLCIVNSCTVTASGDKKTRQMLRRLKRQNPDAVMVLTAVIRSVSAGCRSAGRSGYCNRFYEPRRFAGSGAGLPAKPPADCPDHSASKRRGF